MSTGRPRSWAPFLGVGLVAALAVLLLPVLDAKRPDLHVAFDRYEQRFPCQPHRVSHVALVKLEPLIPEGMLDRIARFEITGGGKTVPVEREGDSYRYRGIFGKDVHAEQFRPVCSLATCTVQIAFYLHEHGLTADRLDLSIEAFTRGGEPLFGNAFPVIAPPSPESAREARYVELDARLADGRLEAEVELPAGIPVWILLQWADRDGRRERTIEEPAGAARQVTHAAAPSGNVTYAGALAYIRDPETGASTENKVELVDRENPLYACPAGEGEGR